MAITETVASRSAKLLLDNGETASGEQKTKSMSIGVISLRPEDWNGADFYAICSALAQCVNSDVIHRASDVRLYYTEDTPEP